MICDCFLYAGEKEMLSTRCAELDGLDVVHLLIESPQTHTGIRKKMFYPKIRDVMAGYPIVAFTGPDFLPSSTAKQNEIIQRNFIKKVLGKKQDDDIIIISDVDEIPQREVVEQFVGDFAALKMKKYNYYLNLQEDEDWDRARIMRWSYLKDKTPNEVRDSGYDQSIPDAGHHFSWMGGYDAMIAKLKSFSHTELDNEEVIAKIKPSMNEFKTFWDGRQMKKVEIDETYPRFIQEHKDDIFKDWIL